MTRDIPSIEPKSRASGGMFFFIVIMFILGASYYTVDRNDVFTDHTANEDINSLIYGFQSLGFGDISGFLEGVLGGITVVALFMIMFALFHFLFTTALKSFFGKKYHAIILSLTLTLYAFVNPRIYNYLLNLNAFAVAFIAFLAVIIMLWGFIGKAGKDTMDSFKGIEQLRKNPDLLNNKELIKQLKKEIEMERRRQS